MHPLRSIGISVLVLSLTAAGSPVAEAARAPAEILIAAAASLAPYCHAMGRRFEAQAPGVRVRFTFASSGHLRQQIEAGAPADGFISASTRQMDLLEGKGLIKSSTRMTLAQNQLVLIVSARGVPPLKTFPDLASPAVATVALGDPSHVPAGFYGRALLQSLGLWERVKPKLIYGLNVRQVLQYVIQGEVDAGIVYLSDAQYSEKGVRTVAIAPRGSHPIITYPMAVLRDATHPQQAEAFFAFLRSPPSQRALIDYGLQPTLQELSQ